MILGSALGIAAGGRLGHVAELRLRGWALLLLAVAVQLGLGWAPSPLRWALVMVCCVSVAGWLVANLAHPGMRVALGLVLLGILANTVVIGANEGMPVSARALVVSGRSAQTDVAAGYLYKHTAMTARTELAWLGDGLPIPIIEEVLSPGDVLMLVGIAGVAYAATRPRRLDRHRRLTTGAAPA